MTSVLGWGRGFDGFCIFPQPKTQINVFGLDFTIVRFYHHGFVTTWSFTSVDVVNFDVFEVEMYFSLVLFG